MSFIESSEELMNRIAAMDRDNSVLQFTIAGKGKFTLVMQEEDHSIQADVEKNPQLRRMIAEGKREYQHGKGLSTSDLVKSLSEQDFR
ncbi:hypothetical protein [Sporosarcina trichiuri]|uniref:hypothetical protein n=1 Tax=Sporosarcina trichiuri TaxID=3056445 RepID=UPI0025B6214C|nr:hypothetical protein [Sporosarcina sp. 0.2-SM1T-5]WJY27337.1 hypothetical protein QWT68_15045 [Sporosarcina sp. 0.2-SM1T-5]